MPGLKYFFLLAQTWNGKKYVIQNVKTVLPFFMKIFIILNSDGIVYLLQFVKTKLYVLRLVCQIG